MAAQASSFTYTATQDCYVLVYNQSQNGVADKGITINGNIITPTNKTYEIKFSGYLKNGDTIEVGYSSNSPFYISVYGLKT